MNDPGDEQADGPEERPPYRRIANALRCVVNPTSMRYHGSPVYLVGGAVREEDPRDADIIIIMPDELFWRAYIYPDHSVDWMYKEWRYQGMTAEPSRCWLRWARDCSKQAAWLTRVIGGPIVDFKTQFETEAAAYDGPRVLLSATYPTPYAKR
jgi:hypothetical protein